MDLAEGVVRHCKLPNEEFSLAWKSIKLAQGVHDRLVAHALLTLTVRHKLAFEIAPLHGLILLTGAPGTGKTTLGRGLADQIAKQLPKSACNFIEVDPHALASASLGRSQQAVTKLFDQTIPEFAVAGPLLVLLDEVETLAPARDRLSMEANPFDVHRATDAALSGIDRLTRTHRSVLLIATTNFREALDRAMLSRADYIEEFELPNETARREIISDTLKGIGQQWKGILGLERDVDRLAKSAEGLDGRRIRKQIFVAMAADIETAKDPGRVTKSQIEAAFREAPRTKKETAR